MAERDRVEIAIRATTTNLRSDLDRAESQLKSFGNRTKKTLSAAFNLKDILSAVGFYLGAREVINFFKDAIQQAADFELQLKKIQVGLEASGVGGEKMALSLARYADALQEATIYSNTEIMSAMAMLSTFKLTEEQIKAATLATLDMAAATGQDLQSAAILMGKAMVGVTGTLSRYGIIVDKAKLESEGYRAVLEEINKEFGGQAQRQLETYTGKLRALKNVIADIKRAIATPLMPGLKKSLDELKYFLTGEWEKVFGPGFKPEVIAKDKFWSMFFGLTIRPDIKLTVKPKTMEIVNKNELVKEARWLIEDSIKVTDATATVTPKISVEVSPELKEIKKLTMPGREYEIWEVEQHVREELAKLNRQYKEGEITYEQKQKREAELAEWKRVKIADINRRYDEEEREKRERKIKEQEVEHQKIVSMADNFRKKLFSLSHTPLETAIFNLGEQFKNLKPAIDKGLISPLELADYALLSLKQQFADWSRGIFHGFGENEVIKALTNVGQSKMTIEHILKGTLDINGVGNLSEEDKEKLVNAILNYFNRNLSNPIGGILS